MANTTVNTETLRLNLIEMIEEASFELPEYVLRRFREMAASEKDEAAVETMRVLLENAELAKTERLPLCQDCGAVIVFLEIGQNVTLEGAFLGAQIEAAVEEAYRSCYLRKSIVGDPLRRNNTGTNAPAFVHTSIVEGDQIRLTVYLKGGGSENMSALKMFTPTSSAEDVVEYIVNTVVAAGPNPCPPLFLGIGIGGTADEAALNSKKAVLRGEEPNPDPYYAGLEKLIEERLNKSNVGALGFGGISTVAGVYIKPAPAHIASLPVAVNMSCHSTRFRTRVIGG